MIGRKKIGLALSGGGYRATIYHLGTLKKLKELGILKYIDVISTNSGGSITGAAYGLYGDDFDKFEIILTKGVKSSVVKGVLTSPVILLPVILSLLIILVMICLLFSAYAWISLILLVTYIVVFLFFQFQILPISSLNEKMYNKFFFHNKHLSDLTSKKVIAINSTNAETGTLFTFSKEKMSDSSYSHPKDGGKPILFKQADFPIARAVAASTCVPFVFNPVKIGKKFYLNIKDIKRANPRLVDGGVYDNQGIHKLEQQNSSYHCDILIVSDAGIEIPFKKSYKNVISLLIRTSAIFMNRIKNFQMIQLIFSSYNKKEIAYQSLGWDIEKSIPEFVRSVKNGYISEDVISFHGINSEDIKNKKWKKIEMDLAINIQYNKIVAHENTKAELVLARNVGTNLTALKEDQIKALINHAYIMTELQVKLYCPTLTKK